MDGKSTPRKAYEKPDMKSMDARELLQALGPAQGMSSGLGAPGIPGSPGLSGMSGSNGGGGNPRRFGR